MLQMVKIFVTTIVALIFAGCNTLDMKGLITPTGEGVNSRFESSMALNGNKSVATITAEPNYMFYVCADPHINNTSTNLQAFLTQMRADTSASFGIVLGDCSDRRDALSNYVEAIVSDNGKPIFSLIGNHDLFFSGWDDFKELLGPSVYWFEVDFTTGRDLFITLDSASGTLGHKQMKWLSDFLAANRTNYRHCTILLHTNLFYTDNSQISSGNLAMEETHYLTDLFSRYHVTLCLQGHDHYREDLTLGGVRYTIVGTIRDEAKAPEYLLIHLSNNGAEYQWQYL